MAEFKMVRLTVNPERLVDFLSAFLKKLSGLEVRAAFWFYQPVVLPVAAERISGISPFPDSDSFLAGEGYIVHLTRRNADTLAAFFANDLNALSALIHLEVESAGQLQLRSYDGFGINLLSLALDSQWLSDLAMRGIVTIE
jgi:hypothetical protein